MARAERYPVEVDPVYGCWIWQGRTDRDGYARVWKGQRRPELAHHVLYREHVGPVPAGQELDHVCRRRACVRPEHLEPVTRRENVRRVRWGARAGRRTCKAGHDLYAHGRRTPEGGHVCLVCSKLKTLENPDNEQAQAAGNPIPRG